MARVHANSEPVGFDFAAAQQLITEFTVAAQRLRSVTASRRTRATDALAEWQGRYARQFAHDMDNCLLDALGLADAYELAAQQLEILRDAAQREQDRRDKAREWEEEQERRNILEKAIDGGEDLVAGLLNRDSPNRPPLFPADPPPLMPVPAMIRARTLSVDAGGF